MAVQFCESCGNLLDDSPNEILECEMCGKKAKTECSPYISQIWDKSKTTTSIVLVPAAAQPLTSHTWSLLQNLETDFTQVERMVLLAQMVNGYEFTE
ncbi:uncharacterized protein BDV14DRAFT_200479 [Aspergillus stella-maris]|uniref:uncharacterized protein n=1 Tax=Aspergillus stella-maris TaxID=1810926 RepID=UPI003CCC9351